MTDTSKKKIVKTASGEARKAYEQIVLRSFWRNVAAMTAFDVLWFIGMAFVVQAVFSPAYLNTLGAPKTIIGLVSAMFFITVPISLLSDRAAGRGRRTVRVTIFFGASGAVYILLGSLAMICPDGYSGLQILLYSLGTLVFFSFINLGNPIYWEVVIDNIPMRRRGRVHAFRAAAAGVSGFTCVRFAEWVTQQFDEIRSFHVSLVFAGFFFIVASLTPLLIRDNVDPARRKQRKSASALSLWREVQLLLLRLWYRPSYRGFIFFAFLLVGGCALGPFLVTYAQDVLKISPDTLEGQLKMVFLSMIIIGGLAMGSLADRWGFRVAAILQAATLAVAFWVAIGSRGNISLLVAYALYACTFWASGVMLSNLSIELMPRIRITRLIAGMNLFLLPAYLLLPWSCGYVIDLGKGGGVSIESYHMVFAIGMILAILSALGFALLVQEPRTGKTLVIRRIRRA